MKTAPHRTPRAIAMIELLVVLMLLGILMVILGQLFIAANNAQVASQKQLALINRVDGMIAQLRRDVWRADAVNADKNSLDIVTGGNVIAWQFNPNGTLTRKPNDAPLQSWPTMPPLSFTLSGPVITLHVGPAGHEETLSLISQQILQGGAK